jgi:ComF family protein
VPLHKKRELDRGYNQSYLIAKAVSKALGFEILNLLERVKNTESQAQTKSMEDRRNNIKDAFSVNGIIPENRQIVLVDDIVTTASTIIECKNALNRSGATNVIALTLASREKNNSGDRRFEKRR